MLGTRAQQPFVEAEPVLGGKRGHLHEGPRRLGPSGAKGGGSGIPDVPFEAADSRRLQEVAHGVPLLERDEPIEDDPVELRVDPRRIQPGELGSARRVDPLQGEVVLEVEAELGTRHAGDVRRVPQALLVPRHAAALVLLAASAGAGLVAPDPLDGPASRRGGRLVLVVQALEEGCAGDLQERLGPPAGGRPQRPRRQSRDQTAELVVPEHVRRGGQEGIDLQAARDAREHARPAGDLASVAIEPPLAAPMGRQEEGHGLPLPGQTAVRDGPDERPDHVARHVRRELGDEAGVREESRALDQVTGLHGNPGVEGGQGRRGEGPREVASDALLEQAVHLRRVPGDLAGQRLDRVPRQAGRLGPKNERMRFLRFVS